MLAPKDVVLRARAYLGEVVPDFGALNPRVEEMVLAPDASKWRVVFYAHTEENSSPSTLADLINNRRRIEKEVTIGAEDGSLIAVKTPSVPF